jgi:SH3 domain-containing protein
MAQAPAGNNPTGKNRVAKPPAMSPAPEAETPQPSFWRMTAVLAVCFVIGVAWPVFGGLNFVQRPPGSSAAKIAAVEAVSSDVDPALARVSAEVAALQASPPLAEREVVQIEGSSVQSCQGDAGERVARCDEPNLDGVIEEPIAKLAGCAGAESLEGVLSLGIELDFARARIARVKPGQSTTFSKEQTLRLSSCAESFLVGTALDDVEHEHARYWVYYRVRFAAPGSPADAESAPPTEALVGTSGQATIGWKTAAVRESASGNAKILAELPYGARVNVTGRQGEWYRIERAGKVLGWVHRQALGM